MRYPIKEYGTQYYLADLLSNVNAKAKENKENKGYVLYQPFKTVGQAFQVFDQETIDVFVPYGEGENLLAQLESMQQMKFHLGKFRETIQKARPYTISIYAWQRKKLEQAGMLRSILDDRALVLDKQAYDDDYGLCMDAEQPVSEFVV